VGLATAYYRFGNWRASHMLPATDTHHAAGVAPGELAGQAPDTSMGTPCEDPASRGTEDAMASSAAE
jgi:hypothetical protein